MCLYKKHWFPKFSREPITVYKELKLHRDDGSLLTPYVWQKVQFDEPVKAKRHWIFGLLSPCITKEGVHAFTKKVPHKVLYKAVIPPHTAYWLGKYHEIAASRMIIPGPPSEESSSSDFPLLGRRQKRKMVKARRAYS